MSAALLNAGRLLPLLTAWGVLTGCGEAAEPTPARDGAIAVEQHDYRFRPEAIRAADGRLRVDVVNRGRLPHALRLMRRGREHLRIPTLLPGERDRGTVRLRPGSYRMVCPIANHEELGMYGVVTVR